MNSLNKNLSATEVCANDCDFWILTGQSESAHVKTEGYVILDEHFQNNLSESKRW